MRSVLLYVSPRIDAVGSEGGSATDDTMKERAVGVAPGGGQLTENHFEHQRPFARDRKSPRGSTPGVTPGALAHHVMR